MNRPTLAAPSPPLADLSLNCVIRRASPKPVEALEHPAELGVRGDLALDEDRRPVGVDAHRDQLGRGAQGALAQQLRVLLDGDRVQVGDEEERLVVLLEVDPLPQGSEVVAEVERVGGRLDARTARADATSRSWLSTRPTSGAVVGADMPRILSGSGTSPETGHVSGEPAVPYSGRHSSTRRGSHVPAAPPPAAGVPHVHAGPPGPAAGALRPRHGRARGRRAVDPRPGGVRRHRVAGRGRVLPGLEPRHRRRGRLDGVRHHEPAGPAVRPRDVRRLLRVAPLRTQGGLRDQPGRPARAFVAVGVAGLVGARRLVLVPVPGGPRRPARERGARRGGHRSVVGAVAHA